MSQHWNWFHLSTCRSTNAEFLNDNCGVDKVRNGRGFCVLCYAHNQTLLHDNWTSSGIANRLMLYSYSHMTVLIHME